MAALAILTNDYLRALIDPRRGADIVDLTYLPVGTELLFRTPWRRHADDVREGRSPVTCTGSQASWLEQYRGGWQLLCPNAGTERVRYGATHGFHGEASTTSWTVVDHSPTRMTLATRLFSMPIEIVRTVSLDRASIAIADVVSNVSPVELEVDYVQHPAFGKALVQGDCRIETGARTFVVDADSPTMFSPAGSRHEWPYVTDQKGTSHDLRRIPNRPTEAPVLGWLTDFDSYWAQLTNRASGLAVRLEWDGRYLPYMWLWQELEATREWPWFRRARVVALEPASTPTSGAPRRSALALEPRTSVEIVVTLHVRAHKDLG